MKKYFVIIVCVLTFLPFSSIHAGAALDAVNAGLQAQQASQAGSAQVQAQPSGASPQTLTVKSYVPLIADFQNALPQGGKEKDFAGFFNFLLKTVIGLTGILAVLMIVIGGIQYVSTDSWSGKDDGKKRIQAALGGLLLALSSYLILNTIDPSLTYLNFADSLKPGQDNPENNSQYMNGGADFGTDTAGGGGSALGVSEGGTLTSENAFPNDAWNKIAADAVTSEGLLNMNVTDAARYFPNGVTAEAWTQLLAKVANKESSFNPGNVYYENTMNKNSVGLLQLSADDPEVRALGYSEEDLKDPQKNLTAGIKIMARQIQKDGCISCKDSQGNWKGGTAYWSTLR